MRTVVLCAGVVAIGTLVRLLSLQLRFWWLSRGDSPVDERSLAGKVVFTCQQCSKVEARLDADLDWTHAAAAICPRCGGEQTIRRP